MYQSAPSALVQVGVDPAAHRGQTSGHHVGDDGLGDCTAGDTLVGVGASAPVPHFGGAGEGVEGDLAGSGRVVGVELEHWLFVFYAFSMAHFDPQVKGLSHFVT
jgi:hypothetical protein